MAKIVLFENIHPSARAVFEAAGYTDIVTHAAALPPAQLRDALRGAQVAGIRSRTHLDAGLLSDNPDLRVKLEFTELTELMKSVDFKVFSAAANMQGGRVVALRVPGGGAEGGLSRGEIDAYTEFVKIYGAKGLAWIKVNDVAKGREGLQSPIVKNLHDAAIAEILARSGACNGDLLFFGADKAKIVNDAMGALRVKIGHSDFGKANGLLQGEWEPLWVVDSRCSSTTRRRDAGTPCTIPSPRPRTGTRTGCRPTRDAASPRPTTWC